MLRIVINAQKKHEHLAKQISTRVKSCNNLLVRTQREWCFCEGQHWVLFKSIRIRDIHDGDHGSLFSCCLFNNEHCTMLEVLLFYTPVHL